MKLIPWLGCTNGASTWGESSYRTFSTGNLCKNVIASVMWSKRGRNTPWFVARWPGDKISTTSMAYPALYEGNKRFVALLCNSVRASWPVMQTTIVLFLLLTKKQKILPVASSRNHKSNIELIYDVTHTYTHTHTHRNWKWKNNRLLLKTKFKRLSTRQKRIWKKKTFLNFSNKNQKNQNNIEKQDQNNSYFWFNWLKLFSKSSFNSPKLWTTQIYTHLFFRLSSGYRLFF